MLVLYLLLIGLFVYFVAGPVLTLVHELGHALPLALAGHPATVHVGSPERPARLSFSLGEAEVRLRYSPGFSGLCRYEEPPSGFSAEGALLVALGGPAASALVALLCGLVARLSPGLLAWALLGAISVAAFLQVFFALLPVRYPKWLGASDGRPSDGLRALRAMGLIQER